MKPGRLVTLIIGCLLALPGLLLLFGGAGLGGGYLLERDQDGYVGENLDRLESPTAAITAGGLELVADPGAPEWLLEQIEADVRIDVTPAASGEPVFIGIGRAADVDTYLAGVAHDDLVRADGESADYRRTSGERVVEAPVEQDFWVAAASGDGPQRIDWTASAGSWAVVLMNADGSAGVAADATVAAQVDAVLPLAVIMVGVGAATTVAATLLIVIGARRGRPRGSASAMSSGASAALATTPGRTTSTSPVTLSARLDPDLSRWQWLVKWVLVIPHLVVLTFLWAAFVLLTVWAGAAILFTGTYPRRVFDLNVGILRWSWRVSYYATTGGLGTDRYPPFSLGLEPDYPATLDVAYPERLRNGLVLVKWLLGLPHYVLVSLFAGGFLGWVTAGRQPDEVAPLGGGVLGVLVLVAAVVLLVTGRYPRGLFDVILGLNRWVYRVIAYAALMTDQYPPFRLDQGGTEPGPAPLPPKPAGPGLVDLRDRDLEPVTR